MFPFWGKLLWRTVSFRRKTYELHNYSTTSNISSEVYHVEIFLVVAGIFRMYPKSGNSGFLLVFGQETAGNVITIMAVKSIQFEFWRILSNFYAVLMMLSSFNIPVYIYMCGLLADLIT